MMAEFQIVSDLHLETPKSYDILDIEPKCPNLVLLGDIGYVTHKDEYLGFLRRHLLQFQTVFLVLGNHEPWHSTWGDARQTIRYFESQISEEAHNNPALGKLVVLDQTRCDFDGVVILGCTLFSYVPADSLELVSFYLTDFYRTNDWTVEQHSAEFEKDLAWLNREVQSLEGTDKSIVIFTHYSPTLDERAVDPRHRNSAIQSGFVTDLSDQSCWKSPGVKLWAFGHTHYNCDFTDEKTGKRVLANQRGYYSSQSAGYDQDRVVKVSRGREDEATKEETR